MLFKSRHLVSMCVAAVLAVLPGPITAQVRFSDRLQSQAAGSSNSIASHKEAIRRQIANGTFKIGHAPKSNRVGRVEKVTEVIGCG